MSPLTKAFVVLATILAVVMVTLTVSIVARVDDYRASYAEVEAAKNAAIQQEVKARAEMQQNLDAAAELRDKYKADLDSLAQQLKLARDDDSAQAQNIADLMEQNARLAAAQASSAKLNDALATRVETLNAQLADATKTIGEEGSKYDQVTREFVALLAEKDRLENDFLRLREENVALQEQVASLEKKVDGFEASGAVFVGTSQPIDGAVTQVDKVSDQLTLVQVNVGTRDNVANDMQFTIYRGDEYVGTIQIKRVDTDASVGELTLGGNVRAGDRVQSGRR